VLRPIGAVAVTAVLLEQLVRSRRPGPDHTNAAHEEQGKHAQKTKSNHKPVGETGNHKYPSYPGSGVPLLGLQEPGEQTPAKNKQEDIDHRSAHDPHLLCKLQVGLAPQ
jgi:hypothetical protein